MTLFQLQRWDIINELDVQWLLNVKRAVTLKTLYFSHAVYLWASYYSQYKQWLVSKYQPLFTIMQIHCFFWDINENTI